MRHLPKLMTATPLIGMATLYQVQFYDSKHPRKTCRFGGRRKLIKVEVIDP